MADTRFTSPVTVAAAMTITGAVALSAGLTMSNGADISGVDNISATTVSITSGDFTGTVSGSTIIVDPNSTGTGWLTIGSGNGTGTGGALCIRDNDNGGWTKCSALNGTLTCSTSTACVSG